MMHKLLAPSGSLGLSPSVADALVSTKPRRFTPSGLLMLAALVAILGVPPMAHARRAIRVDSGQDLWQQAGDAGTGQPLALPIAFSILGFPATEICINTNGSATFGNAQQHCQPSTGSSADVILAGGLGSMGPAVIAPFISDKPAGNLVRNVSFDWGGLPREYDPFSGSVPLYGVLPVVGFSPSSGLYADRGFRVTWSIVNPANPTQRNAFQMIVWRLKLSNASFQFNDVVVEFNYDLQWGQSTGIAGQIVGPQGQVSLVNPGADPAWYTQCNYGGGIIDPSSGQPLYDPGTYGYCQYPPNWNPSISYSNSLYTSFGYVFDPNTTSHEWVGGGRHIVFLPGPDGDADGSRDARDSCLNIANVPGRDSDNDGFGNRCDADLNNDGFVNTADLAIFKAAFNKAGTNLPADLNSSGFVNVADLAIFKSLFNKVPGPNGLSATQVNANVSRSGGGPNPVYDDELLVLDYGGTLFQSISNSGSQDILSAQSLLWRSSIDGVLAENFVNYDPDRPWVTGNNQYQVGPLSAGRHIIALRLYFGPEAGFTTRYFSLEVLHRP